MIQAKLPANRNREAGFTLLEAIIATMILIFGLAAIFNLMIVAVSANGIANRASGAIMVCSHQMEILRSSAFTTLVDNPVGVDTLAVQTPGYFRVEYVDGVATFESRWEIQTLADPNLKYIRVRTEPQGFRGPAGARRVYDHKVMHHGHNRRVQSVMSTAHSFEEQSMSRISSRERFQSQSGFSLIELMVALMITLVITGAMYGLIASGQGSFKREPALSDRQQQIRVALSRMQEDILRAGMGIGPTVQAFAQNMNALGPVGVRPVADPLLGGGKSDHLEVRAKTNDCPSVRTDPANPRNGANYNAIDGWPACYPEPGWVLAFFPDGNAKWGSGHNQHGGGNQKFNFPPGQQPPESQMTGVQNLSCSLDLTVVAGGSCPPGNQGEAVFFMQMDRYAYLVDFDTDGVPSLFRSTNGGIDPATEDYAAPPNDAWQMLARGIEDLQIRYRTFDGWHDSAPTIVPNDPAALDNVIREVEVTLWARSVGVTKLQGETTAAGNGVTAVRGSLTTTIAPRAAQSALQGEANPTKRWQ